VPDVARGVSRLAFDAVEQLSHIVEAMHASIAGGTRGLTGLVYESIRLVNGGARGAVDGALELAAAARRPGESPRPEPGPRAQAWHAALNGLLGDHLAATGNPLAIRLRLRVAAAPGPRPVLLLHGLCMNDRQWLREGHDHGAALARDLGATPVYALYNSGRHVSENGRELAERLEELLAGWPVRVAKLAIVAHSMGGLVARSAHRYAVAAGHAWPARLARIVFLGTPHHGAPLERGGQRLHALLGVSPYTAPLGRLGMLRSAGITDLRHGNLCDEDWNGRDRFRHRGDRRTHVPLPEGVACDAIAGGRDVLVPVASALGRHRDPAKTLAFAAARTFVAKGLGHFDLLDHPEVYERIRAALAE
jgi:pimeloyl-ACP methyl ester carboxylesterase